MSTMLPTADERAALALRVLDARRNHRSTAVLEDALWEACGGDPCDYTKAMVAAGAVRRDREMLGHVSAAPPGGVEALVDPRRPGRAQPPAQSIRRRTVIDIGRAAHPPARRGHLIADTALMAFAGLCVLTVLAQLARGFG